MSLPPSALLYLSLHILTCLLHILLLWPFLANPAFETRRTFHGPKKCSSSTLLIFLVVLLLHVIRPTSENFGNLKNLKVLWFWVELQSPKKVFFFHTFQWLHFLFSWRNLSLPTYLQDRWLALVCPYQDGMWKFTCSQNLTSQWYVVELCSPLWPQIPN